MPETMNEIMVFPEVVTYGVPWMARHNENTPSGMEWEEYQILDGRGVFMGWVAGEKLGSTLWVSLSGIKNVNTETKFDIRTRTGLLQAVRLTYLLSEQEKNSQESAHPKQTTI